MPKNSDYLKNCLYFSANALSRNITKMAEKAFKDTGLSPSYAFMIMLVNEQPGMTIKELTEHLHLAPSTLTRFADKLVYKDLVERKHKGKTVRIYPTSKGKKLSQPIADAWKKLYTDYSAILGEQAGADLTQTIYEANSRLEDLS